MSWEKRPIGEFLTDEQCGKVAEIVSESKGSTERVRRLKEYLSQFNKLLEAKGVSSDFLAYAIEHAIGAQQGRSEER